MPFLPKGLDQYVSFRRASIHVLTRIKFETFVLYWITLKKPSLCCEVASKHSSTGHMPELLIIIIIKLLQYWPQRRPKSKYCRIAIALQVVIKLSPIGHPYLWSNDHRVREASLYQSCIFLTLFKTPLTLPLSFWTFSKRF